MNKIYIFAFCFFALVASCSLDRNNPLESVATPPIVTGIKLEAQIYQSARAVKVSWQTCLDVDGYRIYRSLSYNGQYQQLVEIPQAVEDTVSTRSWTDDNVLANTLYYYKLSSFRTGLEGRLSSYYKIKVQ